jgi:hypothetical protein
MLAKTVTYSLEEIANHQAIRAVLDIYPNKKYLKVQYLFTKRCIPGIHYYSIDFQAVDTKTKNSQVCEIKVSVGSCGPDQDKDIELDKQPVQPSKIDCHQMSPKK